MAIERGNSWRLLCRIHAEGGRIRYSWTGTNSDPIHLSADGLSAVGMDIVTETARQLFGNGDGQVDRVYAAAKAAAGIS